MKKTAFFPLAKLGSLTTLISIAAVCAIYVFRSEEHANGWAALGLLPLALYLIVVQLRARKLLRAEQGREREIVQYDLVARAARRNAQFWTVLFSIVAGSTCIAAILAWAYQVWLWYADGHWSAITWNSMFGVIGQGQHMALQRLFYWVGDTNLGVVILISGAIIAAPLAAINHQSLHKAKLRKLDLVNLKRRS